MIQKTRAAAAALTLMALTGCGKAGADATPSHVYTPLPSFATSIPTKTPARTATPSASPSPISSATPSGTRSEAVVTAPETGSAAVAADPVQAPIFAEELAPKVRQAPAGGPAPVQSVTESTATTTTSVTTTTLESRLKIVVTCEGPCMLGDVLAPELTGEEGPISSEAVRTALGSELGSGTAGQRRLTEELAESLTKEDWELVEKRAEDGQERLVFTSIAERK